MRQRSELTIGQRYGRLTITAKADPDREGRVRVHCLCDCGNEKTLRLSNLRSGSTKSCGCFMRERIVTVNTTHGHYGTPTYSSWGAMKSRCLNPNSPVYRNYGGRGISIHPLWVESFEQFLQDVGPRPGLDYTLERLDVNGNYEPGNVCWATTQQQNRNKRSRRLITFNGETRSLTEWAELLGMSNQTISYRLKAGWTVERSLSVPVR